MISLPASNKTATTIMHELAVCQNMLARVDSIAREHGARQVRSIHLQIGPLSGIEVDLLQQSFSIARGGTLAEDAELLIEKLPVRIRCHACGEDSETSINRLVCPRCGDASTRLLSGDEMLLHSIELAENAAPVQQ